VTVARSSRRAATRRHRHQTLQGTDAPLAGTVALVAGATRGAGRGIARGLAEAGATVYCTGRSVRGQPSPYKRPETIDETAEIIRAAGGTAVPVRVDHTIEAEVEALFRRIVGEHGRLDVLVNSIAGEDPLLGQWGSFWKANFDRADAALRQTLVSHMITAKHAAPYMIERRRGLIVEVTENDILSAGGNPITQTVKLALKALAFNMAAELRAHGVAAVAITPGFLRSEAMLEHFGVTEENWRDGGKKDRNFLESETPLFVGRGVAALAADPEMLEHSGQLLSSWELGRKYRLEDADGRRPDWGAADIDFSDYPGSFVELYRTGLEIQLRWLMELARRTKRSLKQVPGPDRESNRQTLRARRGRRSRQRR
jgi:NAD(P)-dependent dehydrogenase (short-subunit alcohol dehydrogenase family)